MQSSVRWVFPADVDQEVAQEQVAQPRRRRGAAIPQAHEGDFELVEGVVAGLVHARRLRGRPHEQPREHVRHRRVVLKEREHARQDVWPHHEGAREGGRPAEGDVVAAPRARLPPVEHVLLAVQPRLERAIKHRAHQPRVLRSVAVGGRFTSITPGSGVTDI